MSSLGPLAAFREPASKLVDFPLVEAPTKAFFFERDDAVHGRIMCFVDWFRFAHRFTLRWGFLVLDFAFAG